VSFHRRAWYAAADEYGRRRAEQYGRYARARAALGLCAAVVLAVLTIVAVMGAFGG
jgi:hypothetical protein